MNTILFFYREKIIRSFLVLFLFLWAAVSTTFLLFKESETRLLKIHDGAITEILSEQNLSEHDLKSIELSFLNSFVVSYYQFNSETFKENMTLAKEFFSPDGWRSQGGERISLQQSLEKDFISQGAIITQAKKIGDMGFKVKLKMYTAIGGETKVTSKGIFIGTRRRSLVELSNQRPFLYEVTEVRDETF